MADIALIDDVRVCRIPIRQALERVGHTVREIEPSSVFDVMAVLREFRPDLMITDLEMPNCHGVSLIRTVREDPVLKGTQILVVSVHNEDVMIRGLSQQNIQGFLIKPVPVRRVLISATAILEGQSLEAQGEEIPALGEAAS